MANTTRKVNLMQTAYNAASTIAAALIGVGELTADSVPDFIEKTKDDIFNKLVEADESQPEAPRRSYSGGGGQVDGELDPGTLQLKMGKHKGKTLAEVYAMGEEGQSYIDWLANKQDRNTFVKGRALLFLERQKAAAAA